MTVIGVKTKSFVGYRLHMVGGGMIKEDEQGGFFKNHFTFSKYFTFYFMQVECCACEIVFSARAFSLRSNTQRSPLLSTDLLLIRFSSSDGFFHFPGADGGSHGR